MEYTLKNKKLTVVFESKGATFIPSKTIDGDGIPLGRKSRVLVRTGTSLFSQFVEASEMIKHRLEIENRQTCQDMVS